jgi:hypothetical protein
MDERPSLEQPFRECVVRLAALFGLGSAAEHSSTTKSLPISTMWDKVFTIEDVLLRAAITLLAAESRPFRLSPIEGRGGD